jgi:hypothetical protein
MTLELQLWLGLSAAFLTGVIVYIVTLVGKPREPISGVDAAVSLVIYGAIVVVMVLAAVRL